jgi:hypothetical protein
VKATEWGGPPGCDACKKIKGRKRHILTDTEGHPVGFQGQPTHTRRLTRRLVGPKTYIGIDEAGP